MVTLVKSQTVILTKSVALSKESIYITLNYTGSNFYRLQVDTENSRDVVEFVGFGSFIIMFLRFIILN